MRKQINFELFKMKYLKHLIMPWMAYGGVLSREKPSLNDLDEFTLQSISGTLER